MAEANFGFRKILERSSRALWLHLRRWNGDFRATGLGREGSRRGGRVETATKGLEGRGEAWKLQRQRLDLWVEGCPRWARGLSLGL